VAPHRCAGDGADPAGRQHRLVVDIGPVGGIHPWQEATAELVLHWTQVGGSVQDIPSNLAEAMTQAPNTTVLADAGLSMVGSHEFPVSYVWTVETLTGSTHSTSILSRPAWGDHFEAFEQNLHDQLLAIHAGGRFEEAASFKYGLAARP